VAAVGHVRHVLHRHDTRCAREGYPSPPPLPLEGRPWRQSDTSATCSTGMTLGALARAIPLPLRCR
jgi:hypothetical protein